MAADSGMVSVFGVMTLKKKKKISLNTILNFNNSITQASTSQTSHTNYDNATKVKDTRIKEEEKITLNPLVKLRIHSSSFKTN